MSVALGGLQAFVKQIQMRIVLSAAGCHSRFVAKGDHDAARDADINGSARAVALAP